MKLEMKEIKTDSLSPTLKKYSLKESGACVLG
jgi:hypothetical protein